MTFRQTEDEQAGLQGGAAISGIAIQEADRKSVQNCVAHVRHAERVGAAARRISEAHAAALERLAQG